MSDRHELTIIEACATGTGRRTIVRMLDAGERGALSRCPVLWSWYTLPFRSGRPATCHRVRLGAGA